MIRLAKIYKAHGLRGELQLRYLNPDGFRLASGDAVRLRVDGREDDFTVGKIRRATHGELLTLREINDRNSAELWRGADLLVDEALLPQTDEDEIYSFHLVGCQIIDAKLGALGTVTLVSDNGAHDLLHVQRDGAAEWMLPFVDAYVDDVDVEAQRINVHEVGDLLSLGDED